MNVLLLGGSGLLSSEILRQLIESDKYKITIINRGRKSAKAPSSVRFYKADLTKFDDVATAIGDETFDVIIDFVSYYPKGLSSLLGVFKNKCKQYIFISTVCVFERNAFIIDENTPKTNKWDYSINKEKCESVLKEKCLAYNIKYTIVRPYITYGNVRIPYGLMPAYGYHWSIISRIINNKPLFLWDDGNAKTTITHVVNFSKVVVTLINNSKAYNEDFNVVGNNEYTWNDIVNSLYKILGHTPNIVYIPRNRVAQFLPEFKDMLLYDRALDASFDNSKVCEAINASFPNEISLEEGIASAIAYYRDNNYLKGIDYSWDARMDKAIANNTTIGCNLSFINYLSGSYLKNYFKYMANRYLSYSLSSKLNRIIGW